MGTESHRDRPALQARRGLPGLLGFRARRGMSAPRVRQDPPEPLDRPVRLESLGMPARPGRPVPQARKDLRGRLDLLDILVRPEPQGLLGWPARPGLLEPPALHPANSSARQWVKVCSPITTPVMWRCGLDSRSPYQAWHLRPAQCPVPYCKGS